MKQTDISQYISQAFSGALGEDEIEVENIYMFLIYIHFGAIKSVYPSISKARNEAIGLLNYLSKYADIPNEENEDIKLLFESNKDTLLEIIEDIWNMDDCENHELKWLEVWIAHCRYFFKETNFYESFTYLHKAAHIQALSRSKNLPHISITLIVNSFIQLSRSLMDKTKLIRIA